MPRLIAPVESSEPAPRPAPVSSAPAPSNPADDFVPRLIAPAPAEATETGRSGNDENGN